MKEAKPAHDTVAEPKPSTLEQSEDRIGNVKISDSSKTFDDSCFKVPLPPQKKNSMISTKKRPSCTKPNGHARLNESENFGDKIVSTSLQQLHIDQEKSSEDVSGPPVVSPTHMEVCVSIGKDGCLCPRSRQYFSTEYPGLMLEKPIEILADKSDDNSAEKKSDVSGKILLKEVIIDGFSLLLFASADDYKVLKEHESQLKERARAEDKRRAHENNVYLAKLKKSRKNKVDVEKALRKEKRELKEKERQERRAARRLRKEQKDQLARDKQERRDRLQQLGADKKREKRDKRENVISVNNGASTSTDVFGDMTADVVVEMNGIVLPLKSSNSKEKSKEELRRIKREKKLQQMKQQLKQSAAGALDENSKSAPHLNSQFATSSINGSGVEASEDERRSTATAAKNMAINLNPCGSTIAASHEDSAMLSVDLRTTTNTNTAIVAPLISPASVPVAVSANGCATAASTSAAISGSEALKRPSSTIGIAQRNRVILSPLDNGADGKNGIISNVPPATKIRKLETGITDFFNAHQHLPGIAGARASSTLNNNLHLKSEIKMENGYAPINNTSSIFNNSTANSQRSTPLSKGTPLSTDLVHGNSASSSTGPQLSAVPQTPSTSSGSATSNLSHLAKQLPMPGGVDASTLAVIQQLFGGSLHNSPATASNNNTGTLDDLTRSAASLLHQQNLLLHPELINAGHQKLPLKAPPVNLLDSPANLMAAAAAISSGFPLLNYNQHFFQQQQLEQSQKRPISSAQPFASMDTAQIATTPKLSSGSLANTMQLLPNGLPAHLFGGADPSLISAVANTKVPKSMKWADRHVQLATKIAREADHRKNLATAAQLQQLYNSQQQQIQQQLLQQKLAQQHMPVSFLPGNSNNKPTETSSSGATTTNCATASNRKRSDIADNFSAQYKRPNVGPAMNVTKQQQEQQQRQQQQQQQQIAALRKQQLATQQQPHPQVIQQHQMQMEALRRLQQQQQNISQSQQTENIFSQLHQQQQQRLQSTSTPSSSSTRSISAKTAPQQQVMPHQQATVLPQALQNGTASQLLSPVSFMNAAALFHPGAAKTSHSNTLLINQSNEQQRLQQQPQQQQKQISLQPLQQQQQHIVQSMNKAYATPTARSQNILPPSSVTDALSLTHQLNLQNHLYKQQQHQQSINSSLGFPIAQQVSAPNAIAGGSLTSGTSAQANAAAAALAIGDSSAQLSTLLALQQQGAGQQQNLHNTSLNNPVLTQMAMAQLMMQQIGASAPNVNNLNSLLGLQPQQQQVTANNILASLGMLPHSETPLTPAAATPQQIQLAGMHPQLQQRISGNIQFTDTAAVTTSTTGLPISATAVAAPTVSTNTAANAAALQQQQDLLLQAALLHGIQSLEAKQQPMVGGVGVADGRPPPMLLPQHQAVHQIAAANSASQRERPAVASLPADQLQQQHQLLLERIVGLAGGNARGMC